MKTDSTLEGFLKAPSFRSVELGVAGTFLAAVTLFFVAVLTTREGSVGGEMASGFLWLCAVGSLLLPVLVVSHAGYDLLKWLLPASRREGRTGGSSPIVYLFRAIELGLAAITIGVVGSFGYLMTTHPGGPGAGSIAVGVVLIVATVSVLLSVLVLVRGVLSYVGSPFDAKI